MDKCFDYDDVKECIELAIKSGMTTLEEFRLLMDWAHYVYVQRWVPLAEKHPDDGQLVLMLYIDGSMHVLPFNAGGVTSHISAWKSLTGSWKGETE